MNSADVYCQAMAHFPWVKDFKTVLEHISQSTENNYAGVNFVWTILREDILRFILRHTGLVFPQGLAKSCCLGLFHQR